MKDSGFIQKLRQLTEPIVEKNNYELYHLEFVKEGGENYFRIYIDNTNGIFLEDCEKVSRAISDMMDVEDPIAENYYLEVSSPGMYRILYNDKHIERYIGHNVLVSLKSLFNGKKKYEGALLSYNESEINIDCEGVEISIPREKINNVSLNPTI